MKIPEISCLIIFGLLIRFNIQPMPDTAIVIEECKYENRDHYQIKTATATYLYDKAGGGFSRMIDPNEVDWINFKGQPRDLYPASAAAAYRGIPNLVYGSDESGAGHPGHDHCITTIKNNRVLHTKSLSGKWEWEWEFFDTYAKLRMIKIDPGQPYWFLYEGVPGGQFQPSSQYFGHHMGGPFYDQPDHFQNDRLIGDWDWFYCGAKKYEYSIFFAQLRKDNLPDFFSYLGNSELGIQSEDGMVVFGFGRAEGAKPMINTKQEFIIGFFNQEIRSMEQHRQLEIHITSIVK